MSINGSLLIIPNSLGSTTHESFVFVFVIITRRKFTDLQIQLVCLHNMYNPELIKLDFALRRDISDMNSWTI